MTGFYNCLISGMGIFSLLCMWSLLINCSVNMLYMELSYTGSLDRSTRASEHVIIQISYACRTMAGYHCFHLVGWLSENMFTERTKAPNFVH